MKIFIYLLFLTMLSFAHAYDYCKKIIDNSKDILVRINLLDGYITGYIGQSTVKYYYYKRSNETKVALDQKIKYREKLYSDSNYQNVSIIDCHYEREKSFLRFVDENNTFHVNKIISLYFIIEQQSAL